MTVFEFTVEHRKYKRKNSRLYLGSTVYTISHTYIQTPWILDTPIFYAFNTHTGMLCLFAWRDGKSRRIQWEKRMRTKETNVCCCQIDRAGSFITIHALAHTRTPHIQSTNCYLCVFVEETDRHINSRRLRRGNGLKLAHIEQHCE